MSSFIDHGIAEDELNTKLSLKMYEALASGKGIQHILDVAWCIFNNPILVADNSFKVIAHAESSELDDDLWLRIINSGYYPIEYTDAVLPNDDLSNKVYSDETTILSDGVSPNRYLSKKIVVNGKPIGFASCVEIERRFTTQDIQLFNVFCKVVATELRSDDSIRFASTRRFEYLLCEMLSGQVNVDFLNERIQQVGIRLNKNHFILVAEFRDEKMRCEQQMHYYRSRLEQVLPSGYCAINRNSLIVLISKQEKILLNDRLVHSISKELEFADMICGVSNSFQEIADFHLYYQQAREAIKYLRKFVRPERIIEYWKTSCYHILEIVGRSFDLRKFCDPKLKSIIDYDAENKTKYALTAYEYLRLNRDPALTAKQLHVHRNTIDYRLKRIEEVFDLSFNDQEVIFSFELSFKILNYLSYSIS